jgi:hypothetical protein
MCSIRVLLTADASTKVSSLWYTNRFKSLTSDVGTLLASSSFCLGTYQSARGYSWWKPPFPCICKPVCRKQNSALVGKSNQRQLYSYVAGALPGWAASAAGSRQLVLVNPSVFVQTHHQLLSVRAWPKTPYQRFCCDLKHVNSMPPVLPTRSPPTAAQDPCKTAQLWQNLRRPLKWD